MTVLSYDGIQCQHDTALTAFASSHQNKATRLSARIPMETTAFMAVIEKLPMNGVEWDKHHNDDIIHRIEDKSRGKLNEMCTDKKFLTFS